ncbi:MAG: archease [Chloroflexia bacterium]
MNAEKNAGYRLLEHTADAGLVAWGLDPAEAFSQAVWGMFEVVLGDEPRRAPQPADLHTLEVQVEGQTWDDMLVNWLAELVYHFDVDGFVPVGISFSDCAPPRCEAQLTGWQLADPDEAAGVCIKAITYHQLSVQVTPTRTDLKVIFDI